MSRVRDGRTEVERIRRERLTNATARAAFYKRYKCVRCGEPPSIHHDENEPGGQLCTPCRRDVSAETKSEQDA